MIEAGHFAELENILRLTLRQSRSVYLSVTYAARSLTLRLNSEDEIEPEFNSHVDDEVKAEDKDGMQTFVFSATMSKDLQRNVKKRTRPKAPGNKKDQPASTLGQLLGLFVYVQG